MAEKPFPLPPFCSPSFHLPPSLPPSLVEAKGSYYVTQAELKVMILLPLVSEHLDDRHVTPNPATVKL